jgi:acetoin utilization deacetylase AcuC-like enzyme
LSLHGAENFPLRKQQSRLDVPLPNGTTGEAYLDALREALPAVWATAPEIVFYQAGVDALAADKLGLLSVSPEALGLRDGIIFRECHSRKIPVVTVLGGGYADPIHLTVNAHAETFRAALREFGNDVSEI